MGLHLVAGTLNQAALARGRAKLAAVAWLVAAALFVVFVATPTISAEVTRVEVGYFVAALVLCGLLWAVYRRGRAGPSSSPARGRGAPATRRQRLSPLGADALAGRFLLGGGLEICALEVVQARADAAHRRLNVVPSACAAVLNASGLVVGSVWPS